METRHGACYDDILALALATERAGFDAFFRSDHLLGVDPNDATYRPSDCWTTLAGLARDTGRVRLGALATAATFRSPGMLASVVASIDDMSGGRVELGLGTGWYDREHAASDPEFPSAGERFDRLEEQLEIIAGLWGTRPGGAQGYSLTGSHYRVEGDWAPPPVTQSPHPPVIIGGTGPGRTPAIAARFADEFNAGIGGDLRERYAVFARACEAIGRDPEQVRRSVLLPVACGGSRAEWERRASFIGSERLREIAVTGSPEQVAERIIATIDAGADTVYLHFYDIYDLDHVALIGAEVLPHVTRAPIGSVQLLERTGI